MTRSRLFIGLFGLLSLLSTSSALAIEFACTSICVKWELPTPAAHTESSGMPTMTPCTAQRRSTNFVTNTLMNWDLIAKTLKIATASTLLRPDTDTSLIHS